MAAAESAVPDAPGSVEAAGGPADARRAAPDDAAVAAKGALRQQMRRIRRAIPAEERTRRGRLITRALWLLPELRRADVVLSFSSFGSEVPTDDFLGSLQEAGVTVFLPFLDSGEMDVAEVARALGIDPQTVRSAHHKAMLKLAFDRRGGRLGYGGGNYDKFLRRLPADAVLIGLAFSEQIVAEVPMGEDDLGLHLVVTDQEVVRCQDDSMNGGST